MPCGVVIGKTVLGKPNPIRERVGLIEHQKLHSLKSDIHFPLGPSWTAPLCVGVQALAAFGEFEIHSA